MRASGDRRQARQQLDNRKMKKREMERREREEERNFRNEEKSGIKEEIRIPRFCVRISLSSNIRTYIRIM